MSKRQGDNEEVSSKRAKPLAGPVFEYVKSFRSTQYYAMPFRTKQELRASLLEDASVVDTKVKIYPTGKVKTSRLEGVISVIDRDLGLLSEPESSEPLDLFADPSKSVLFSVEKGEKAVISGTPA
jgi:hypothetical protein